MSRRLSRRASVSRIESPDRHADGIVDLLEAIEIDHHHGGPDVRIGLGEGQHRVEAIEKQFAVRQPGQMVMDGVVEQALLGHLGLGDVGQGADQPHHLAVRADHRPRLDGEPEVVTVGTAQAEILDQPAAALIDHVVERGAEAVAVERMEYREPLRRRSVQGAALEAESVFGFRAGEHVVGGDVPVPDQVAGPGQRQRAALYIGDDAVGDAAGEGVLHHGEADQHDDQHQAAEQGRRHDVVGDPPRHREAGGDDPGDQQEPGRDQQHRAIEALGGEIDDEAESGDGDEQQRQPRDARGDRRIDQRDRDQRAQEGEPGQRDMGIADVPAVEVEIGEQEHQQRRGEDRFAGCPPHPFGAGRHVEHLAPESEVDADVDQHRPAQRGGGGKHHAALDHEQDGQEQRQQAGDADDDAVIEGEAVDLVLVGVGLPQIELRQLVGAHLRDIGDHRAGIEGDAEDVGGGAVIAVRPVARAGGDVDDARQAEIGPQNLRAHHLIMRHHDQAVDLLVARIRQRKRHPVGPGLAGAHLDAADDPVIARRGGHLDAVAVGLQPLHRIGEIDRRDVDAHIDGLDGTGVRGKQRHRDGCSHGDVQNPQAATLRALKCLRGATLHFRGRPGRCACCTPSLSTELDA